MDISRIALAMVLAMSSLVSSQAEDTAPAVQVDDEGLAPIKVKAWIMCTHGPAPTSASTAR